MSDGPTAPRGPEPDLQPDPRRVLVLVGKGRYEDPWHDHAATSWVLGRTLAADGWSVQVRSTTPDALAHVAPGDVDLLVVNAGQGRPDPGFDGDDAAWAGFHDARQALVAGGVPVLAVHQSANTFGDDPRWAATIGGRWVDDVSWHPPIGTATFRVVGAHPVTTGLADVTVVDEQYLDLQVDPAVRVLLVADHDGAQHPVAWVAPGPARAVYVALGHDTGSIATAGHGELLRRAARWLTS